MGAARLLILAGTAEARRLCEALAGLSGFEALASLAGATSDPLALAVPTRRGGFGGAAGLASYLRQERIDLLVDATHPFAAQISANAAAAAAQAGVPMLIFTRAPWSAREGDNWIEVDDVEEAAEALGAAPRLVFLTHGRRDLAPFRARPQHAYVMRAVDAPDASDLPPRCEVILDRGPFREADERRLLEERRIDIIVSKNSGGPTAKIDAARALGLPVVMIRMPARAPGDAVFDLQAALAWIESHRRAP